MKKGIVAFLVSISLGACNPKTEAELEATAPTVLTTDERIEPLYRRVSVLSRDCKDAADFLGSYQTDAEFFEKEGLAEITYRGRGWYGSAPISKIVIRDLGNTREVRIFDAVADTPRITEWVLGKNTCR